MTLERLLSVSNILAIDPGNKETGWCVVDSVTLKPIEIGKTDNTELITAIENMLFIHQSSTGENTIDVVIEMIASYGMPVGKEVFDTCVYIGRLVELCRQYKAKCTLIYRKDEKMTICHSMKANDATIKQALVDRFAYGEKNYGKGTKANKGWFYGFKADIWSAYAVAVTYSDMKELDQLNDSQKIF